MNECLTHAILDVSVQVGKSRCKRGGGWWGGGGRWSWEWGMLFCNPYGAIQCKLPNDFLGRLFNKVS